MFEISTTEEPGIFEVSAKFMGVTMEKVELVFQVSRTLYFITKSLKIQNCSYIYILFIKTKDLLQMQYEGASIMKMFDRAKINVNLLIFLLNKKFYGK